MTNKPDRLLQMTLQFASVMYATYHMHGMNDPEYNERIEEFAKIFNNLTKEYRDLNRQGVTRISMVKR